MQAGTLARGITELRTIGPGGRQLALLVLVASGIAWRIVYVTVPKRVPANVGNLSVKDTRSRRQQIQVEIEKATAGASEELKAEMLELNLAYQDRFGHVFLICATGRTGEQMRDAVKERIGNSPE